MAAHRVIGQHWSPHRFPQKQLRLFAGRDMVAPSQ